MKSVKSKNANLNDSREMRTSTLKPDEEDWLNKAAREAFTEAARQAAHPKEEDWLDEATREALSEAARHGQQDVRLASPEFDPKMFQTRVGVVAELAKTYVDSGVGNFKTFISRIVERHPDKFGNMKPYLRSVWNAVAEQMKLEEIPKDEAETIYAETEYAMHLNSGIANKSLD